MNILYHWSQARTEWSRVHHWYYQ